MLKFVCSAPYRKGVVVTHNDTPRTVNKGLIVFLHYRYEINRFFYG